MKKLTLVALGLVLLSCAGHFYLTKRTYELSAGFAGASAICNINKKINCDQALLSPYAKVFGVSLSNFGFSIHLVLALLLLILFQLGLNSFWKNLLFYLSSLIALSSVFMIVISLTQSLYCPICWSLYILSFLTLALLYLSLKKELLSPLSFFKKAFLEKNSYLITGAFVVLSLFLHATFVNSYGLKDKRQATEALFRDFLEEPVMSLNSPPFLIKKSQNEKVILTEFADFLCPSCKRVQPALKKFLERYPDVSFHFYPYPLDGTCNPYISFKGSGLSCKLSKALLCVGKEHSLDLSDFFFEKQRSFLSARGDDKKTERLLHQMLNQLKVDKQLFEECMLSEAIENRLLQSIETGESIGIRGTPTFLMNGKKIRGHSEKLLILDKIYQHLK